MAMLGKMAVPDKEAEAVEAMMVGREAVEVAEDVEARVEEAVKRAVPASRFCRTRAR